MKRSALTSITPGISAGQQIYGTLKQFIVNCTFEPGEPISDKEISDMFGVSRQPVRDAFIKLADAGLIQILPQRGTFVRKISIRQVKNARFVREAIETAIVRKAALSISSRDLQTLDDIVARQHIAAERNDAGQFLVLDDEFHHTLVMSVDCAEAWQIIDNFKALMDRIRFLTAPAASPIKTLTAQHAAIVAGLHQRDPDQTEAAIRIHLQDIVFTFGATAEQHPGWFEDE